MMIIWKKSQKKLQVFCLIMVILSPVVFTAGYVANIADTVTRTTDKMLAYQPDPTQFVNINYSRLNDMVEWTDNRFEQYHMPLNMSCSTNFYSNGTIESYRFTDNMALRGGFAITAFVFKYVAGVRENNATIKSDALRVLKNLTHGFTMLLRVPNGGLGPEYPGILARGYSPPDPNGIGSFYFQDHPKEANGTGIYSDWRWRGFTSNDEHSGFYLALAVLLKYVDDPEITNWTRLMIEQIANYMVKTNFIGFQQYGGPSGIEQKPRAFTSGFWVAIVLKMASIVNPDVYIPIYYHWLSSEGVAYSGRMGGAINLVGDYFGFTLDYGPVFGYLLLEDPTTAAWNQLYKGYIDSLWHNVKNNRNAYFNVVHLAILAASGQAGPGDYPVIEHDIEDQLMRMDINHFPEYCDPRPTVPGEYTRLEEMEEIKRFATEDPIGVNFADLYSLVDYEETWYAQPLSVEFRPATEFLWEISPFHQEIRHLDPLCETAGLTLITPYWIGRAFGFILPEGGKINAF